MVSKTYILKEPNKLNKLYNRAIKDGDQDLQKFYSKLALLELCGWIEESMDNVVQGIKRRLKDEKNKEYVDSIIKQNYGFGYEGNFRNMLIKAVGIHKVEQIERKIDGSKKDLFKSSLGTLREMRHDHAHSYIHSATVRLHAPSAIRNHFNPVYDGLKSFEKELRGI
ncbi:MAG: hypothetical protein A3C38_03450 [Planctomycetes bacterium RIFCSPHIGHO2_02_FULL_50_42]|nr:MAG: hypothetical protein A3C38_03450 [Planctomycetes bacterium RIFCSPHIGHO2_02_FULL_50_42]OHB95942.1 MAG: hypothetical protein A3I59_04315 [Planctomycetes bacterium RIFCSPLOWO2_02_FULL_50_16]OHC02480.1 MAG: hypothetical protein A3G17_06640 [Planctomycetes bacterium RIFCSPLOWO2_12_FULL_50_35]